jgi:hypothetical protein
MSRFAFFAAVVFMLAATPAGAQPSNNPDQAARTVSAYVYLMDGSRNKVLISTQFWRNDPKYDDRAFHRFLDVMTALEKRGFHKDDKATIDSWDKPEPFVRCYIYLEDVQAGRKTKRGMTAGTRLWCSDNGASELELNQPDSPKYVETVMHHFDTYFERAKKNVHK